MSIEVRCESGGSVRNRPTSFCHSYLSALGNLNGECYKEDGFGRAMSTCWCLWVGFQDTVRNVLAQPITI